MRRIPVHLGRGSKEWPGLPGCSFTSFLPSSFTASGNGGTFRSTTGNTTTEWPMPGSPTVNWTGNFLLSTPSFLLSSINFIPGDNPFLIYAVHRTAILYLTSLLFWLLCRRFFPWPVALVLTCALLCNQTVLDNLVGGAIALLPTLLWRGFTWKGTKAAAAALLLLPLSAVLMLVSEAGSTSRAFVTFAQQGTWTEAGVQTVSMGWRFRDRARELFGDAQTLCEAFLNNPTAFLNQVAGKTPRACPEPWLTCCAWNPVKHP